MHVSEAAMATINSIDPPHFPPSHSVHGSLPALGEKAGDEAEPELGTRLFLGVCGA